MLVGNSDEADRALVETVASIKVRLEVPPSKIPEAVVVEAAGKDLLALS